jgi:hypothetical protein
MELWMVRELTSFYTLRRCHHCNRIFTSTGFFITECFDQGTYNGQPLSYFQTRYYDSAAGTCKFALVFAFSTSRF